MLGGRASGVVALAAALAAAIATARTAEAQPLLQRFDPAERGSRFFVADSLELDGHLRFATGVVSSYGYRLRTFRQSPGDEETAPGADQERSNLVEHAVWVHPGASLVLAPGARFGLDLPIAFQTGNDVALDRRFYATPGSPRLGDVRASFDLRVAGSTRPDVDGAVLALGVSAYLPTGSGSSYASDDYSRVAGRLAGSLRHGPIVGAARVGYMYRADDLESFGGVSLGSEANAVLAVGYRFDRVVLGPELHGATILKDAFARRSTPIEVLWGAHLSLGGDLKVGVGIGSSLVAGLGAPRLRAVLSIEWAPGSALALRDRDNDGVPDPDDMCPDVPGLGSAPSESRGCPAAPRDGDGDGIIDAEDACPDVPGIRSSRDPAEHGCPETTPPPP